jgi:carbon storage regulator
VEHIRLASSVIFDIFAADEISPVPLTLSFQHVQFIKGGARSARLTALCSPTLPVAIFSSEHATVRAQRDVHQRGAAMLVLSRKKNESIIISDNITVTVIEIRGDKVRLGIEAPKHVTVHRREVYEAIQNQARALEQDAKVGRPEA